MMFIECREAHELSHRGDNCWIRVAHITAVKHVTDKWCKIITVDGKSYRSEASAKEVLEFLKDM